MISTQLEYDLKASIRNIPDYPKPGIMFRDITTLLGDARAFRRAVDELVQPWAGMKIDKVAGEMEMHEDAVVSGERVVLIDDLIATGGTAEGAVKLLRHMGAEVLAACFIIDLPELGGADKLRALDVPVRTLLSFEGH
jgi:adenine phosphoribosyltransferase